MDTGDFATRRFRFDGPHGDQFGQNDAEEIFEGEELSSGEFYEAELNGAPEFEETAKFRAGAATPPTSRTGQSRRIDEALKRTRRFLLSEQHNDGHWVAELEGDTILESEYILLLAFLGREKSERALQAARYIEQQQLPTGGWAIYPDGPLEISASVKAYWTLKLTGHDPSAEYMVRAKNAIRAAGGAELVNSFTRFYFALLGIISYQQCPAVPPELMFLPRWMPFNIYEMSAWSRTIVVPLSLMWALQPVRKLDTQYGIDELFLKSPAELPVTMGVSSQLDDLHKKTRLNWDAIFRGLDQTWKVVEKLGIKPFRKRAVRLALKWIEERLQQSDGLGAIFPPIIWTVAVYKALGYADESPQVAGQMHELERLMIQEGETVRLQPCKSPVWDTAISVMALREAGLPADHRAMRKAAAWLLAKEVRQTGDWSVRTRGIEPSGWFFEYENRFYPDIDDTIMVSMGLNRCLPGSQEGTWGLHFLHQAPLDPSNGEVSALLQGTNINLSDALTQLDTMTNTVNALRRSIRWITAMQNRDGGWGAFDVNNDRELFTRVPFADHNAMIDPSTPDITGRVLEMYGRLGVSRKHPAVERGLEFLWKTQEPDGSWIGRWGVNYLYGTWQVLVGLNAVGISNLDHRVCRGANWLKGTQQECGGWGETPRSYDELELRGKGDPTPSQTAWALMGLCAAGEHNSEAVERGVQYLLNTQLADGTWEEGPWTGTGFPRVFYLKYHYYRIYFPLMALARVVRTRQGAAYTQPRG